MTSQMKKIIVLLLLAGLLSIPVAFAGPDAGPETTVTKTVKKQADTKKVDEPAALKGEPKDISGAIDTGKKSVEFAKAQKWFAFSASIIFIVMFLFKQARKRFQFMKGIPKRVLWILVPILSVAAMLLTKFQEDLSWGAAMTVLTSGPSAAFLNDLLKRGILNREPSAMKKEL